MSESDPFEITKLQQTHRHETFDCGQKWLNEYIRQHALKNEENGYGRTYVLNHAGCPIVRGFFTVSMSSVMFMNLPDGLLYSRIPKYPMPVAHLGCLAVQCDYQKRGLGDLLLMDAFHRILAAADLVAARALEVKAIDEQVRGWYMRRGFAPFKDHKDHLYISMETIRQAIEP